MLSKQEIYDLIPQYPNSISKRELSRRAGISYGIMDNVLNSLDDEGMLLGEEDNSRLFRCDELFKEYKKSRV